MIVICQRPPFLGRKTSFDAVSAAFGNLGSLLAAGLAGLVMFTRPDAALAAGRGDVSTKIDAGLAVGGLSLGAWAVGRRLAGPSVRPRRHLSLATDCEPGRRVAGTLLAAGERVATAGALLLDQAARRRDDG